MAFPRTTPEPIEAEPLFDLQGDLKTNAAGTRSGRERL